MAVRGTVMVVICILTSAAVHAKHTVKCQPGDVAFETLHIDGNDVDVLISGPGCPEAKLHGLPLVTAAVAAAETKEPPETVPEAPKLVVDRPESVAPEGELSTASSALGRPGPGGSRLLPWLLMMLALLMVGGAFMGHRLYDQQVRQPRLLAEEKARLVAAEDAQREAEEEERALRDAEEGLRRAAEQEALRLAREAAERQAREEAERLAKDEADRRKKEEDEQEAQLASQRAKEAEQLKAKEQAAEERRRKQREEADELARAEAKRKEEAEAARKKGCCAPCGCGAKPQAAEPARPVQ